MIGISIANDSEVGVFESLDALGKYLEPWYFSQEDGRVFDGDGYEYDVLIGKGNSLKFERRPGSSVHGALLIERLVARAELGEAVSLADAIDRFVERYGFGCI